MQGDGKSDVQSKSVRFNADVTASRNYGGHLKGDNFSLDKEIELKRIMGERTGQKSAGVLVLDFDNTIVNGHMHNSLSRSGVKDDSVTDDNIKNFLDNTEGFRNRRGLQSKIEESLDKNIAVAVASHSSFPNGIKIAMNKLLGEELADKVSIVTCGDRDMQQCNIKGPLISEIAEVYGINDKDKIVLVDDNQINVENIKQAGYKGIHAKKNENEYLDEIGNFHESIKEELIYANQAVIEEHRQGKKDAPRRDHNTSSAFASNDQNNASPKKENLLSSIVAKIKQFFTSVLNFFGLGSIISNDNKADAKDGHNNSENVNEAGHGKAKSAEQNMPSPDSHQHVNEGKHGEAQVDIKESIISNLDEDVFPKNTNERRDAISAIKACVVEIGEKNGLTLRAKRGSLDLQSTGIITDNSRNGLQNLAQDMAKTLSEAKSNNRALSTRDDFIGALQASFGHSKMQYSEKSLNHRNESSMDIAAKLQSAIVANEINALNHSGAKMYGSGMVDSDSNIIPGGGADASRAGVSSSAAQSR